jgi:hypothetical protein
VSHRFLHLDPDKLRETLTRLVERIRGRFPEADLAQVAGELERVAQGAVARLAAIRRASLVLRALMVALAAAVLALPIWVMQQWHLKDEPDMRWAELVQGVESAISAVVFLGAALLFVLSLERRLKRQRALRALLELRSIAHIVDLHQLTKDPDPVGAAGQTMTRFDLSRYLDFCSEMLALTSKVGALYGQGFPDAQVLDAVDGLERLVAGLSAKIWQKITILDLLARDTRREA